MKLSTTKHANHTKKHKPQRTQGARKGRKKELKTGLFVQMLLCFLGLNQTKGFK